MMSVIVFQASTTMIPESRPSGLPQKTPRQSLRPMVDALSLNAHAKKACTASHFSAGLFCLGLIDRFFTFNGLRA